MEAILDLLHDYVALSFRALERRALSREDRGRWLALSRLIPGDGNAPRAPAGSPDGDSDGLPVQIIAPGGFEAARLLALSREGVRVATERPMPVGAVTALRIVVPKSGLEYVYACRVQWIQGDTMGLLFDGPPTRTSLSRTSAVGWKRTLDLRTGWFTHERAGTA